MCVEYKKKPTPGKCHVKWCTNDARIRSNGKPAKMCYRHESRRRKEVDPEAYTFYKWKHNSKARGIENTVTLAQFRKFCAETSYIEKKGRGGGDATIDRIRNAEGYHIGNLQVLEKSENSAKGNRDSVPF